MLFQPVQYQAGNEHRLLLLGNVAAVRYFNQSCIRQLFLKTGAMLGRNVTRGMFLTSGTFDEATRQYAANLPNLTIELIDGAELQQTLHAILCGPLRKWWE